MAQGDRLEKIPTGTLGETPESKAADELRVAEKAERLLFDLNRLLKEYSVMPDSFILPGDYSKSVFAGGKFTLTDEERAKEPRLLKMKENKLRTTWFNKTIEGLSRAALDFDIELAPFDKLRTEFKALLQKEDSRWLEILGKTKDELKQVSKEDLDRLAKPAIREASKEFLAEKIRLVYGFDALLKEAIKHLKKFNKNMGAQPSLSGASARQEEQYEGAESV
jgi:hypothetical protein